MRATPHHLPAVSYFFNVMSKHLNVNQIILNYEYTIIACKFTD